MTTMTEILEKHAHLKRCRSVKEGGCGEMKAKTDFPFNLYTNEMGRRVRHYYSHCRDCLTKRKAANKGKNAATKRQLRHTGEVDPVRKLFFCQLKPVPMSREIRAARRG